MKPIKGSKAFKELEASFEAHMKLCDVPMLAYPWRDKTYYAAWLGQLYYFLCHATRLLCASAAQMKMDEDAWHLRMVDHAQQEKTHERMALSDLRALGFDGNEFPELPITAQLYQSQYYLIEHVDPAALFGCVLYLEGISLHSIKKAYSEVADEFGPESTEFLRTHTQEDVGHIRQALEMISKYPEEKLKVIQWSLEQCSAIWLQMVEGMKRQAAERIASDRKTRKAA